MEGSLQSDVNAVLFAPISAASGPVHTLSQSKIATTAEGRRRRFSNAPICVPDKHATSPRTSKNRTRITSQRIDPFCARKREVESKVVRSRPEMLIAKIEWARNRESNVGEHRRRRVDEPGQAVGQDTPYGSVVDIDDVSCAEHRLGCSDAIAQSLQGPDRLGRRKPEITEPVLDDADPVESVPDQAPAVHLQDDVLLV